MKFIPYYGTIVCKQIVKQHDTKESSGIVYEAEQLPIYEVQEIGILSSSLDLSVGDKILTNSIPTKLEDDLVLVREEYVAGKIATE